MQQIQWKLYCTVEDLEYLVAEFLIVGDSKTRKHLAHVLVCKSVFIVAINVQNVGDDVVYGFCYCLFCFNLQGDSALGEMLPVKVPKKQKGHKSPTSLSMLLNINLI